MADGEGHAGGGEQDVEADEPDQHDAEGRREDVPLTGARVERFGTMEHVQHHDDHQVEHAAAERIAHGDIGRVGHCHGANARGELGERGDAGEQHETDPRAAETGFLGNGVAVTGQLAPGHADQQHA